MFPSTVVDKHWWTCFLHCSAPSVVRCCQFSFTVSITLARYRAHIVGSSFSGLRDGRDED